MKQILLILTTLSLSFISNDANKSNQSEEGYYYYSYASLDKYTEHIYITPVQFVKHSKCDLSDPRSHYSVSNQFNEYMKSEYNGIIYTNKAEVFGTRYSSRSKAEESRRKTMSYSQKVTKIHDFKYYCD